MVSILSATVVDVLIEFFKDIMGNISLDILLYIFVGLMLASIVASIFRLVWCYEDRAIRQMRRINRYLKDNPRINDNNLVEFHQKMKKLPRRIRDRWQLFMLEREGSPSRYLNVEYCVKRPLYNSPILMIKKLIGYTTVVICILSFILSLCYLVVVSGDQALSLLILLQSLVIPFICSLIGCLFCIVLHLRYTAVNHNLYDLFTVFVRNIDKATNSMPDYVDYELLFTKKEIDAGIPVLREYLEKRAMEEQRLLEKAKQEEANHSPYDFSDLDINGEQLIERAVTESEKFLMSKLKIQQEINELEKQLQKTEQNMEDIERDANRKLQAIKENLERLDKAMAETTNNVEVNYNRRQVNNELNKKATLEKDLETMLAKEKVSADALRIEIQKRKESIEKNKEEIEVALKSEYETFSTKVYQELNEKITRDNSEQMHEMEMVIARLKAKVKEFSKDLDKKETLVEARNLELDNLRQQLNKLKNTKKRGKEERNARVEEPTQTIQVETAPEAQNPQEQFTNTSYEAQTNYEAQPVQQDFAQPLNQEFEQPQQNETYQDANANYTYQEPVMQNPFEPQFIEQNVPQDYVIDNQFTQPMEQPQQMEENQQVEQNYVPFEQNQQFVEQVQPFGETQPEMAQNEQVEYNSAEPQFPFTQQDAENVAPAFDWNVPNFDYPVEQPMFEETSQPQEQTSAEEIKIEETSTESKQDAEPKSASKTTSVKAKKGTKIKPARKTSKAQESKAEETTAVNPKEEAKVNSSTDEKTEAVIEELKEEIKNTEIQENTADKQEKKETKKYAENDDLVALQKQIEEENQRLKKQQEELRAQIDKTLKTMEKATNASKAERTRNIKKIKELIAKLKKEAEDAKARGASKTEINKINKSVAELVKVIADYQSKSVNLK